MSPRVFLPLLLVLLLPALQRPPGPQEKKAVAVLRFENNSGDDRFEHLGRALSTMMISDLSVVEEIQLVERERIEEIMAELQLQHSGYVDPETAQSLGMIVGAEYVVAGAFVTVDPEIRLDTRVAQVETAEIVKTAQVAGPTDQLFDLQQRLADQLVSDLGVLLTEEDRARLRAQQEANRIDDLETMVAFSTALCYLDGGAYVEAFEKIQEVREAAPGSAVVGLTFEHLKERAGEEAKSRLTDRANRAIGGLLGRRRQAERPTRALPDC